MIVNLKAPELREALASRAQRLEARAMQLGLGQEGFAWPEGTALHTARYYARLLGQGSTEAAAEILAVLVDETEANDTQFWSTPLGRALFLLGAFPQPEMSRATAAALLGLKSRQRIHQYIVDREVTETMGGTITTDSVRAHMRAA
jgi:hypothetical protein